MDLSELKPQKVVIPLEVSDQNGEKHSLEVVLRPYTLADEAWTEQNYKDKVELARVFEKMDMKEISKMVFHQCTIDTKRTIMAVKFYDIDESGNDVEVNILGHEKLMGMINGFTDGVKLFKGLLECKGLSMPMIEALAEDDLKKKGILGENEKLTGLLSSI